MTSILWWTGASIGVVIALGIIVIGAAYLARNATNAAGFGLPTSLSPQDRGWWQVKGIHGVTAVVLLGACVLTAVGQAPW
ncbi:hypothetical protein [Gordonia sp. i37]|uniref:hypothetical protein n=1 Tax=Gordonia sp. i37 TaxID=1961707 RepID=UPI0009AC2399|nr:hypothetical protein [Gordonia sp. i37]OPX11309.1 hypothetical protein B1964_22565 [Gordonia sp. i37]